LEVQVQASAVWGDHQVVLKIATTPFQHETSYKSSCNKILLVFIAVIRRKTISSVQLDMAEQLANVLQEVYCRRI